MAALSELRLDQFLSRNVEKLEQAVALIARAVIIGKLRQRHAALQPKRLAQQCLSRGRVATVEPAATGRHE